MTNTQWDTITTLDHAYHHWQTLQMAADTQTQQNEIDHQYQTAINRINLMDLGQ